MRAASDSSSISSPSWSDAAPIIKAYSEDRGTPPPDRVSVRAKPKMVASGVRRSWHARLTSLGKPVSSATFSLVVWSLVKPTDLLTNDLHAPRPEVQLGLSRVGVTGVSKAIRLRRGPYEKLVSA